MSLLKLFFITIFCFALTESNANGNSADFADSHPLALDGAFKRSKLILIAEYCNYEISREQYLPGDQANLGKSGRVVTYTVSSINFNPVLQARFDLPKSGYRVMTYEESRGLN